ncbi:hypothetical protein [Acinetobacter schindleri]|uniref:hypothetical protein n=1 Tax=Acinetobacter schindleri TaxID=108981 RepID=UPI0013B08110|nr:hypothetical protein [Acinetobacter schindleri]QIC63290.1 hypothetical protein FSC11_02475 [Acinetobacter schindleri]
MTNHPCQDKCSDFTDEHCRNCLIQIEAREFELGVAPEEAYIKSVDSHFEAAMQSIREIP